MLTADQVRQALAGARWDTVPGGSIPGYDGILPPAPMVAPPQPQVDPSLFLPSSEPPSGYAEMFQGPIAAPQAAAPPPTTVAPLIGGGGPPVPAPSPLPAAPAPQAPKAASYGTPPESQQQTRSEQSTARQALLTMLKGSPSSSGAPTTDGTKHGEIRKGSDGKAYQWVQKSGAVGGNGRWGWSETTQDAPPSSEPPLPRPRPDVVMPRQRPAKMEAQATKPTTAPARTYTIKKGDTLSAIAKRNGISVKQLAKKNGIKNPNLIMVGRVLKL